MATSLQKSVSVRFIEDSTQVFLESYSNTVTANQYVSKQITLATGVVNQAVDLTPLTSVSNLYIETTATISMKLNLNTNPAITVTDVAFLGTSGVTALYLSNSSGQTATIKLVIT